MRAPLAGIAVGIAVSAALTPAARADRSLGEYRYLRRLAIDLAGRPPSRAELAGFGQPGFDLAGWIDARLAGPAYAERIRRIYTDLLRLDLPEGANPFTPPSVLLRWTTIQGPDGRTIDLYFRDGQRRKRPELDGQVCFTQAESGLQVGPDGPPTGTAKPIPRALLDERTVVVKPWWLYADDRARDPVDRAGPGWIQRFGIELAWSMFTEPDGKTPMTGVRVCREEAQTADTGRVYATGRVVQKSDPLLPGRLTRLPADTPFARANAGRAVSCLGAHGFESSLDCGCGVGLERCLPASPNGFVQPWLIPLGADQPFDRAARPAVLWMRTWWSQEAIHFLDRIFGDDRDVREILTSPATVINGPLAQFYRFLAGATCCGDGAALGYDDADPLFDPAKVPARLTPIQAATWVPVEDRGPHAAGVMTMPIFLLKYASSRQRAHAIYSAFLCHDFVAPTAQLVPSNEPDLTHRPGCATCHRRLEPLAAYFARIRDSDWTTCRPRSSRSRSRAAPPPTPRACRPRAGRSTIRCSATPTRPSCAARMAIRRTPTPARAAWRPRSPARPSSRRAWSTTSPRACWAAPWWPAMTPGRRSSPGRSPPAGSGSARWSARS